MFNSIRLYLVGSSRILNLSIAAFIAAGSLGCGKQDIGWGFYQQMASAAGQVRNHLF